MTRPRKSPEEATAALKLPPKVSFQRESIPRGIAYVFRHATLGELGRMCVTGTDSGETCVVTEIAGDEGEPMFAKRRKLLEPLSLQIAAALESIGGPGNPQTPVTPSPAGATHRIPVEEVRCPRCHRMVALLVFAQDATDDGRFEDCARQMYPHYAKSSVPTFILGPELGTSPNNYRAAILKVWPTREPKVILSPEQFRPRIDALVNGHCR